MQTSLLLWLGEWFLDITVGTPYLQGILGKYSESTADTTIQDQTLQVADSQGNLLVTDISSFESVKNPDTRNLSVAMSIDTIYGPTQVQMVNYGSY